MRWVCLLANTLVIRMGVSAERVLVWEDNFDGDSLDEVMWAVKTGNGCDQGDGMCGWGNDEQQTYTSNNHHVQDGLLWITAEKVEQQVDERWYTSSRVRSMPPVAFLTGRIEARIQLPLGLGLWPAFWMLPSNSSRGNWAATGEIDIMESTNDMDQILGTIHYGGEWPANLYASCKSAPLGSDMAYSDHYHVYAIEWEKEEMRWYVDDQLFCQRTKWSSNVTSIDPFRAPFDTEFELLLNLAVGGMLPGHIVDDSIFPATMLVDYVRVYNISSDVAEAEPFLGLPLCLPGTIQAEAFDTGGLGLGYGESQPYGESGTYRVDGAGLVSSGAGRTFVTNLTDTDWLAYTVMTDEAIYDITFQVSTPAAADLELIIGDVGDHSVTCAAPGEGNITGVFMLEATGGVGSWGTTVVPAKAMPAGTHSLKLCVGGGAGISVDSITFELVEGAEDSSLNSTQCATSGQSRPYMYGEPWVIPGYMEAEYYDYGGPGVGFHKEATQVFYGDSTLRLPDAVGITEAESNPSHGHYVGHWETGEWLAFTARADEAALWDVGASIASGMNGTSIQFRVLVNATNCSSPATDGFDGLGDEGVDLLSAPLLSGFTGSWEAFEMVYEEEVYIPAGTHRFLFCADEGVFNLDFLQVWTPTPTPAPAMAPTVAPTLAPQAPGDDGFDMRWIYIGAGCGAAFLAFSRLGFIIYSKERSRTRDMLEPAYTISKSAVATTDSKGFAPEVTPPSDSGGVRGDFLPNEARLSDSEVGPAGESWDAVGAGHAAVTAGRPEALPQQKYRDLFSKRSSSLSVRVETPTGPNKRPNPNAFSQSQGLFPREAEAVGGSNASSSSRDAALSMAASTRVVGQSRSLSGIFMEPISRSDSSALPSVSPLERVVGVGAAFETAAASAALHETPWAKSGLELQRSGSLWDPDPATFSPMASREESTPSMATHARHAARDKDNGIVPQTPNSKGRDQFESALLRALDSKWEGGRPVQGSGGATGGIPVPNQRRISRSASSPEGVTAMLMAVKTWTCVCRFENSVGQSACLGCGRIAPRSRPETPSRRRLPPHRMNSAISPPSEDYL